MCHRDEAGAGGVNPSPGLVMRHLPFICLPECWAVLVVGATSSCSVSAIDASI